MRDTLRAATEGGLILSPARAGFVAGRTDPVLACTDFFLAAGFFDVFDAAGFGLPAPASRSSSSPRDIFEYPFMPRAWAEARSSSSVLLAMGSPIYFQNHNRARSEDDNRRMIIIFSLSAGIVKTRRWNKGEGA